jgi:hypothetical protein
MSSLLISVVVANAILAVLVALRWELADLLLDRFGALAEWWTRGRRPEQDAT